MKKLILSVFALAAVVLSANAQATKTATLQADAVLLQQLSISTTPNAAPLAGTVAGGLLQFGNIGLSGVASTVLVSAAGARSAGTGTPGLTNTTTAATAASFYIGGGVGLNYAISIPATLTLTGGGGGCTVSDFVVTNASLTRAIAANGLDAFAVGGTLNIPAGATAGAVTGQFLVSVNYN